VNFAPHSFVLLVTWTCASCARSEPPGSTVPPTFRAVGVATTADTSLNRQANDATLPSHATPAPSAPRAAAITPDAGVSPQAGPASDLLDEAGNPKPQTEDLPNSDDPRFQARLSSLCTAIIEGNPEKGHSAFFPLVAYRQVKAISDPDRDFKIRLLKHFDRDIIEYGRRIAKKRTPIKCSGLRIPHDQARWMKPGSEYNRIGYFRVLRSQLDLTGADGNTTTLEVTSLISWRGQWYVVHLNGFE
jgi:hypothetical protein